MHLMLNISGPIHCHVIRSGMTYKVLALEFLTLIYPQKVFNLYESSHEFQTKKKPQQHTHLPTTQQAGPPHAQMQPGPNPTMHGAQPAVVAGLGHHHRKPQGPSGGPGRYPPGGDPGGGYNHLNRGVQGGGGGDGSGPYPLQGREHLMGQGVCLVGVLVVAVVVATELE